MFPFCLFSFVTDKVEMSLQINGEQNTVVIARGKCVTIISVVIVGFGNTERNTDVLNLFSNRVIFNIICVKLNY